MAYLIFFQSTNKDVSSYLTILKYDLVGVFKHTYAYIGVFKHTYVYI